MKHSIKFFSALLLSGLPIAANAACNRYPNQQHGATFPSTITVPQNLPVGGLIASRPFSGPFPTTEMTCTPFPIVVTGRFTTLSSAGQPGTYDTPIPGVGMRVSATLGGSVRHILNLTSGSAIITHPNWIINYTAMQAEFYKTGPVTTGELAAGGLFDQRWNGNSGRVYVQLNNSIRFVNPAPTCDLAAGDVNRTIGLPTIRASALRDVSSAEASNFELTANCSNASSVTFRFTGTPASGDAARFANTGSARGVGLWLYSRVGGSNQTISNGNTRVVTVSGNRAVLPLGAAYWKNGTVTQGSLSSTTTVAITYN